MMLNLLLLILAPIFYPLGELFKPLGRYNPFWIFLNDEPPTDWYIKSKKDQPYWLIIYQWKAIRNPAWNFHKLIRPKQGKPKIISSRGYISINNKKISNMTLAVLKGKFKDGQYADNKGEYIDLQKSKLGSSFNWYKVENNLYFRGSFANYFLFRWVELHIGANEKRYTFRFKIKNYKQ